MEMMGGGGGGKRNEVHTRTMITQEDAAGNTTVDNTVGGRSGQQ